MSKGTSHYNWQKWISQTDLAKKETKNKKVLKEMNERWINAIMPAVLAATKRKNDNFKLFFGDEGNRIVIPYDETKMRKLGLLIKLCGNLLFSDARSTGTIGAYRTKLFKALSKDPNFDLDKLSQPEREEFLKKIPPYMKNYQGILNYPFVNIDSLNIRQNVVKQKFTPLGGGAPQEKDVTYYEPVIEYTLKTPLNPMMGQEAIQKHLKENPDTWGNGSYTSKSYTVTIGQILQKFKETELFNWWQQNQLKFSQDKDTVEGAKEFVFNGGYDLGSDLDYQRKEFNDISVDDVSEFSILISRAPVDVLRMSDFASKGMTSCHREGGEYFYCALAEARNQGAIAYLVRTEDINKVDLNATEIFADPQRGIEGITPEARVRIRRVMDNTTNVDFMAPETRTYGRPKVSFTDTVNKWVASKTAEILLNDPQAKYDEGKFYIPEADSLELKGGSYSDSGMHGLGMSLIRTINSASKLISQTDEENDYLSYTVDQLEAGFGSYGLSYTGHEDEDEGFAPCRAMKEETNEIVQNFDRRADFAAISAQVECDDDDFDVLDISSQIQFELQIDRRDDGIVFNTARLNEVFGTTYLKEELVEKIKYLFDNTLRNVDDYGRFNSSEIDVNIQLYSGPQIYTQIRIIDSHATSGIFDGYAIGAREILNKLDYNTDIREMVLGHLRNIGVVQLPPISKPEVQDMIQRFVEDLTATGGHMIWKESEEGEWDQFILVENPARETVETNYPIVAKIPTPKPTANQAETSARVPITDFVLKKDMIRQIINATRSNYTLNREFDKVFGDSLQNSLSYNNKQLGFKGFPGQIDKGNVPYFAGVPQSTPTMVTPNPNETANIDTTPVVDNSFEMQFVIIDQDVQNALVQGADFLNVRLKLTVKIDQNFRSEQEVINATNFIEKIGKEENYQKILEVAKKVFNEEVMNQFKPDGTESYLNRNAARTGKAIEKSALEPNQPLPQDREVEGPLFSGNPMYKDQRLPENKNRRLVINERFKRLLRNIKK